MANEECCQQETFDIIGGKIHNSPGTGVGLLVGAAEFERFFVNGSHTGASKLHPLSPGNEKDVICEQETKQTKNQ